MLRLVLVSALVLLAAAVEHHRHHPQPLKYFCSKHECPKSHRVKTNSTAYKARVYKGAKWVGTSLFNISDVEGSSKAAFHRLYNYISGNNDKNMTINMTAPAVSHWYWNISDYSLTGARLFFYVPKALQKDTPAPLDDSVKVFDGTGHDCLIYYRAFAGKNMTGARYEHQFKKLGKALHKAGLITSVLPGVSVTAEYAQPGVGKQRHEVAFVDKTQCM